MVDGLMIGGVAFDLIFSSLIDAGAGDSALMAIGGGDGGVVGLGTGSTTRGAGLGTTRREGPDEGGNDSTGLGLGATEACKRSWLVCRLESTLRDGSVVGFEGGGTVALTPSLQTNLKSSAPN